MSGMETTRAADEDNLSTTNATWRYAAAAGNDDDSDGSRYHVYLLLAVYPIAFLFGVFGNTLVIAVVLKYVYYRSTQPCTFPGSLNRLPA